jgi:hypothetical protein
MQPVARAGGRVGAGVDPIARRRTEGLTVAVAVAIAIAIAITITIAVTGIAVTITITITITITVTVTDGVVGFIHSGFGGFIRVGVTALRATGRCRDRVVAAATCDDEPERESD